MNGKLDDRSPASDDDHPSQLLLSLAMRHLHRPRLSSRARKTVRTMLDLTIRGLEVGKDTISAAAPVPGLNVALDVLIEVLKKVQVVCLRSAGCITDDR